MCISLVAKFENGALLVVAASIALAVLLWCLPGFFLSPQHAGTNPTELSHELNRLMQVHFPTHTLIKA